jgi:hypothetical protein
MNDMLCIAWGDYSLMTTAKHGSFTRERIREIKRKFAHISKADLVNEQ